MNEYCTYITIYDGVLMPQYYIGSTYVKNIIENSYFGSVCSKKYKKIFYDELRNNPQLFDIIILETFSNRKNALKSEYNLQKRNNVVKNKNFINMSLATVNGFFGMSNSGNNSTSSGNTNCKNRVWINNGCKSKMVHVDKIPDGWNLGRSKNDIAKMKANQPKNQNYIWIYNVKTNVSRKINKNSEIPPNCKPGRGEFMHKLAQTRKLRHYQWFHDTITQKDIRVYENDNSANLVKGRSEKFKQKVKQSLKINYK